MGHYKNSKGIDSFRPDNGPDDLYIDTKYGAAVNLYDLLIQIKDHFGEQVGLSQLEITAEHIHTDCLGYDLYDSGDYTDFIHIHKVR